MPYYYWWDPTYFLVIIGAVICLLASAHVNNTFKKYSKYQPEKYNCISIDDDYILPLGEKLYGIKMINPCLNEKCKTLCYYGVTIIPVESLSQFRTVFIEENNHVYNQMISLIDRAIAEQKNIIHYGV